MQAIVERALKRFGDAPAGLSQVLIGGPEIGAALVEDRRVAVLSATGSTAMGRKVAPKLAERFARAILELGGNNAGIVCPSADLDQALRAIAFAALGTAGQRCTTLRRAVRARGCLRGARAEAPARLRSVVVGDPRQAGTLIGPLIDGQAFAGMEEGAVRGAPPWRRRARRRAAARQGPSGGPSTCGRARLRCPKHDGPEPQRDLRADPLRAALPGACEAIALQNAVGAGLSSSIFTRDIREAELFLSSTGSDCGIANVNIGPSGAEIAAPSAARRRRAAAARQAPTAGSVHAPRHQHDQLRAALPLAQGVTFDVG